MNMKKIFRKEVIIGICAILSLIILFSGIEFLKGINVFKPSNTYYITYNNVAGLGIASPVTVNGFKVGQVLDIQYEYNNPGHVLVEISMDKGIRIPQNSKAILSSNMMGEASISIEMSAENTYYNIGDRIHGITPNGLLDNVSQEILPSFAKIIPKVDSLLTSINKIVSNPAIHSSVNKLNEITTNLSETTAKLNSLVGTLPPTVNNINGVTSNLNKITSDLAIVSEELKNANIDSTLGNLNKTTQNLQDITSNINNAINSNESSLGLLVKDNNLYNNINGAASNLDSLLFDMRNKPKRYFSIKLF